MGILCQYRECNCIWLCHISKLSREIGIAFFVSEQKGNNDSNSPDTKREERDRKLHIPKATWDMKPKSEKNPEQRSESKKKGKKRHKKSACMWVSHHTQERCGSQHYCWVSNINSEICLLNNIGSSKGDPSFNKAWL